MCDTDLLTGAEVARCVIVDNPGNGDCLFHAIGDALRTLKWKPSLCSVATLRNLVANRITQDQYETLCAIYRAALEEKELEVLRDYSFMLRGQESLEALRDVIRTRSYLGDEMALYILEATLRLNIHVLSVSYVDNAFTLRFKRRMRDETPDKKVYANHIILMQDERRTPAHYTLLQYDGKEIMRRETLPPTMLKFLDSIEVSKSVSS